MSTQTWSEGARRIPGGNTQISLTVEEGVMWLEGWAVDQSLGILCQTRGFAVNLVVKIGVSADLGAMMWDGG